MQLHNRRQMGVDASPISVGAIKDWLDLRRYQDEDIREFIFDMVSFLDNEWRKLTAPKKKSKKKSRKRIKEE